jgi:hypothetical protein
MTRIERLRLAYEQDVRDALSALEPRRRAKLREALRQYGDPESIPPEFWRAHAAEVRQPLVELSRKFAADCYADGVRSAKTGGNWTTAAVIAGLTYWWLSSEDDPPEGTAFGTQPPTTPGSSPTSVRQLAPERSVRPDAKIPLEMPPFDATLLDTMATERTAPLGERYASSIAMDATASAQVRLVDGFREIEARDGRVKADILLDIVLAPESTESIVVTRATAGAAGARRLSAADLKQIGLEPVELWITEADSKVCPLCRPLARRPAAEWERDYPLGPPAHPNCRCDTLIVLE